MRFEVESIREYSDEMYESTYQSMPQDRKLAVNRYKFKDDKRRSVFAYALLKKLLNTVYPDADISTLYKNKNGRPHLLDDRVFVSMSHSGAFVACAVSLSPVGIDVEADRSVDRRTLRHACTPCELSYIFSDNPLSEISDDTPLSDDEKKRFLRVWTAKEAYLKMTGQGLSGGLGSVEVADSNGIKTALKNETRLISEADDSYTVAVAYQDI